MSNLQASVVIPVYNQSAQLKFVLEGFNRQTLDTKYFEIILVDDGSSDAVSDWTSEEISVQYGLKITIIHTPNKGRSHARNVGIGCSAAPIIIFCDADRIPNRRFVEQHIILHRSTKHTVVVGLAYDYYGTKKIEELRSCEESYITKKSKVPMNYRKLYMFSQEKFSNLRWLCFLVGNSSVDAHGLRLIGGFSEAFTRWGFEHFELGYRYYLQDYRFVIASDACNFHLPHRRNQRTMREELYDSAAIFQKMHPEVNSELVCKYLLEAYPADMLQAKLFIEGKDENNV